MDSCGLNILKWTTASEINNDYFTLEKSIDAEVFTPEGVISGAGNSTNLIDYSFTDYKPMYPITYYHLKQTDYDGAFTYSNVVAVRNREKSSDISIWPSPSSGIITLSINEFRKNNYNFILENGLTQIVYKTALQTSEGENKYTIDLSAIPKGVYHILIYDELSGMPLSRKLILSD